MALKYVYVAGPMSKGWLLDHIRAAVAAGDKIMAVGGVPYLPQITVHWDLMSPHLYEEWMTQDFAWIERVDCVVRLPGESAGADREVLHAKEHGKPVFYSLEEWYEARLREEGK